MTNVEDFERHRRYLTGLAYRMLGSVSDADDVVQDTYLRWRAAGEPALDSPLAWFTRTCTRLCLDRIKASRRERESYVGEWLPEPLPPRSADERAELDETLSVALLLTVQRLRPGERAAFLLHDVFGYEFTDIADMLGLEAANCRQLATRARQTLRGERPAAHADEAIVRQVSDAFFEAIESGDMASLRTVLADHVVLHSDGGGKVAAARRPVEGLDSVARFLMSVLHDDAGRFDRADTWFNGAPGTLVSEDGRVVSAFQFRVEHGKITGIYVQRNPDKLGAFTAS